MRNILVTGGKGQLGLSLRCISKEFPDYSFDFMDIEEMDITDKESISNILKAKDYFAVINCAAFTAVDLAEGKKEMAYLINVYGVRNLVEAANETNTHLIHISTDYVFGGNGNTPFKPYDEPNPNSVYGKSKLEGERQIMQVSKSGFIIIRTSWLYSEEGNNFLKTMIRIGRNNDSVSVIYDQVGTPTYAGDLARAIILCLSKINNNSREIFHFSNEGVCSWYDFAKEIMEEMSLQCKVLPILTSQYPTPAKRPYYSVLNKDDIKNYLSIEIPHWKDSLKTCIKNIKA
ncbi:MAG: dTDP-4-dehydrorhamnose reductase [Bacteroidales bacterium]|jgi:dTDP-4-dehydrorhamnose reductase|nr:dTDP-4-dehydrorhamnose reductase [Bacteroidales bacterium]